MVNSIFVWTKLSSSTLSQYLKNKKNVRTLRSQFPEINKKNELNTKHLKLTFVHYLWNTKLYLYYWIIHICISFEKSLPFQWNKRLVKLVLCISRLTYLGLISLKKHLVCIKMFMFFWTMKTTIYSITIVCKYFVYDIAFSLLEANSISY